MTYLKLYKKIFNILNKDEKIFSFIILLLTLISIFLETFGIATFFPLISYIVNENYFENEIYQNISNFFGIKKIDINIFFIFFIIFFILKGFYLIFYNYVVTILSNKISLRVSSTLYDIYLKKNFSYRSRTNTAMILRNLTQISSFDTSFLRCINLVNELFLITGVIILLAFVNIKLTILILLLVVSALIIYNQFTKNAVRNLGKKQFYFQGLYTQNLLDGLNSFREILILNKKKFFKDKFKLFKDKILNYQLSFSIFASIPRVLIEIILVITVIVLIIILTNNNYDIVYIIPTLGVFSAAAFRLFPSILKIYSIFQGLNLAIPVVDKIYDEINPDRNDFDFDYINNHQNNKTTNFFFNNSIDLKNIYFNYPNGKEILTNINFKINKGETIGIKGGSGSGKSTLLNIICGFLKPSKGDVLVDNQNINNNYALWRKKIGYISQDFFLIDASIAQNIAFGHKDEEINFYKINQSIKMAELDDFILDQPEGYNQKIGEKGSKISGGQRQRINIARAIYHSPEILLLDEATSSLDKKTEDKILNTLKNLKKKFTIILISHHDNPLRIVDNIFELKFNSLKKI
jgi:ABC-type multidrug transport system fused ATPase/permease subunit